MPISKHKRALIIGSSYGVNVAIVSRLASEGADVVFTYARLPAQAKERLIDHV